MEHKRYETKPKWTTAFNWEPMSNDDISTGDFPERECMGIFVSPEKPGLFLRFVKE